MFSAPQSRSIAITQLANSSLRLGQREYLPLVVGGMGVDISVPALALEIARLGGIGHLSDAMLPAVVDRRFGTSLVKDQLERYRDHVGKPDKAGIVVDLADIRKATELYVGSAVNAKRGEGGIFVNVMEKLLMGAPKESLSVRLNTALDAGADGITLSAGLHLASMDLMKANPRFRDAHIGIIVSSARALKLFLNRATRAERLPDYIIVEGPLAGGHLGFPLNWQDFDLGLILDEVLHLVREQSLDIPVLAAGGVFTAEDALAFMKRGASGVQVATRFAISQESGLPDPVKQLFIEAEEDDIEVNLCSPTGYPMRMLKSSPAITMRIEPMCEAYGYGLDKNGYCSYNAQYYGKETGNGEKTCLCAMMFGYKTYTCGQLVWRLKETTERLPDGSWRLPTAEEVFRAYCYD